MSSGELQNAILDTSTNTGKGITAKKRFLCDKTEDNLPMPNCPEFLIQTFDAFLRSQPTCAKMKIDYEYKKRMSFVLEISPDAWRYYLEQTNQVAKSNQLIHESRLLKLVEALNTRTYDSDTGLLGWKTALSNLRRLSRTEISLDQFKKFRVDKAVLPYRKHSDSSVKEVANEIVKKFRSLYEQDKLVKQNQVNNAPQNNSEAATAQAPEMTQEELDDLF